MALRMLAKHKYYFNNEAFGIEAVSIVDKFEVINFAISPEGVGVAAFSTAAGNNTLDE